MSLAAYALLVLVVGLVFFAAVPGTGAFVVRARWRGFRGRISASSLLPFIEYSHLAAAGGESPNRYRFLGTLEAIQGEDKIWVSNGHFSVAADLSSTMVYLLPSPREGGDEGAVERNEERVPDEAPRAVRWRRIFSLPQGIQIYLAGSFVVDQGRGVFRSADRDKLLVVIYDGDSATLLRRATWSGRQRNEYWNQYTLASLVAGSFSLLLLAFFLLRSPYSRIPALLALTAAAFPLSPLLPPGVLLYIPYRQLWSRARLMRAERDLLKLPLRYFPEGTGDGEARLPSGERYAVRVGANVRLRDVPPMRVPAYLEAQGGAAAGRETRTYGALGHDDLGEHLVRPEDPMAEFVRIPGEPGQLARECSAKARLLEWLSAALIVGDIAINLFLLLLLLGQVL
jgi:hypothetical protein